MTPQDYFDRIRQLRPDVADAYSLAVGMLAVALVDSGGDKIKDGVAAGRAFGRLCVVVESIDDENLPEDARRWLLDHVTEDAKTRALDEERRRAN